MNLLKKTFVTFLVTIYNKKLKFFKIRMLIKFLIRKERISIKYRNVNLLVGLQSAIETSILFDEYNEELILRLIKYFASKNYNFIDVGANVGVHSLIASEANSSIEIFAFEPEPNNFYNFITNISLNSARNIRPFCVGIENKIESKNLNINSGWNKGRHSLKLEFGENTQQVSIPIATLDTFKEYLPIKPLVVKIDVEGFEKEALEGAKEILEKTNNCLVIIELLEENNDVQICEEITQSLQISGFNFVYKIENENQFIEVKGYQGSADYIFVKGIDTFNYFKKFKG